MKAEVIIEGVLTVVDRTLRREFPNDYDKRCAYSAVAICNLLCDAGIAAQIVGGNFAAFVVSHDSMKAGMEGYGFDKQQPAHLWVEAEGYIIDLSPHYLPRSSSFPVADMPPAVWPCNEPLPSYLRYQSSNRFTKDDRFSPDPDIEARAAAFLTKCRERQAKQTGKPKFATWLLTGPLALRAQAARRNCWARNALRFETEVDAATLPF